MAKEITNQDAVGSKDQLIDTVVKANGIEIMDLELYLSARGIVCIPRGIYEAGDY